MYYSTVKVRGLGSQKFGKDKKFGFKFYRPYVWERVRLTKFRRKERR